MNTIMSKSKFIKVLGLKKYLYFLLSSFLVCILIIRYIIHINIFPEVTLVVKKGPEIILTASTSKYTLSASLIESLTFLEHVYLPAGHSSLNTVIAAEYNSGNIFVSKDLGAHFHRVYAGRKQRWLRCFTTRCGNHLLWEEISSKIWLFDKNWKVLEVIKTGKYPWHGSWSIAENNNIIMYAEYASKADTVFVWWSKDSGYTWKKVFFQKSRLSPNPQIRHFHTIQNDPYFPGNWYLSSGDYADESRIWLSRNDGSDWKEVTDPHPDGTASQSVHRFTSLYFDSSYIYWGTDDRMDGKAKFVRAERSEPLKVEVLSNMGNLVKSLVSTPFGLIFISEQKTLSNGKLRNLTIQISSDKKTIQQLASIPSSDGIQTGFTFSRSSIASTKNGVFFSYFDGHPIFINKRGMLKWKISVRKNE